MPGVVVTTTRGEAHLDESAGGGGGHISMKLLRLYPNDLRYYAPKIGIRIQIM